MIHGVQVEENGNLFEVMKDIARVVDVTINDGDIDAIHRIPTKKPDQPIVVKFTNRWKSDEIKWKRRGKRINASDIGFETESAIYIEQSVSK